MFTICSIFRFCGFTLLRIFFYATFSRDTKLYDGQGIRAFIPHLFHIISSCFIFGGAVNKMYGTLVTLLVVDAIIMIVLVLLQSGKSAGLSGAISGGAEQLFGKQKARGIDAVLHRATIVTGILFFVITFALGYIVQ